MSKYNRYSEADYRKILEVYEECGGVNETSRITEFPVATVHRVIKQYETVEKFNEEFERSRPVEILPLLKSHEIKTQVIQQHYSYILGLYLGDGHISKTSSHRVHRMMIFLDKAYPQIIERCRKSLSILFADNEIGLVDKVGCVSINLYSQQLPQIFPQHGAGKKHNRDIILDEWQEQIVDQYPLEFFRGLYHSDGSRSQNIVKGRNYPRYTFSNVSDDIRRLFTATAEKLGLNWTTANKHNVAISRRDDVTWLDKHIGEKS